MFQSLRVRLWLSYFAVVSLAMAVVGIGLLIYFLRNPIAERDVIQRLRSIINTVPQPAAGFDVRLIVPRLAQALDQRFNVRVLLFNTQAELLLDTRANLEKPLVFTRLLLRRDNGTVLDSQGQAWLYVTRNLLTTNTVLVLAELRPPRRQMLSELLTAFTEELFGVFLQAILFAMVLGLLLAYVLTRWMVAPLQRMAHAAQQISEGKYPQIVLEGPAEVQTLGRALNQMTQAIQKNQQFQRDWVANVSHELKTPLTSIQGFAQALIDGVADTPEAQRSAAYIIYNEAERMYRLVYDLLDLARLQAGTLELRYEQLSLSELLLHLLDKFSPQFSARNLSVQTVFEPNFSLIHADPDRLTQIFTNLLENAIRYSPDGGVITLKIQTHAQAVHVSFSDQGPGIPPEAHKTIFERFYRANTPRGETVRKSVGLGLAIARELALVHGGDLWVESAVGQGSTFICRLPVERMVAKS